MSIYTEPFSKFERLHPLELRGTEGIKVELIDWPANPYEVMAVGQSASWRPWKKEFQPDELREMMSGISEGKIWAGQVFEAINFTFAVENVSRACTHQIVRMRVGAGFMQESGREGSWDKAPFITPLNILEDEDLHQLYVTQYINSIKLYEMMKTAGIGPQDARMIVPHAVAQNIWITINFRALQEWCSKRLCTNMGYEINTLARMCRDAVAEKFPSLALQLKSHCERSGGHKAFDNTNFYAPGAENNGNKVYYELDKVGDKVMCGKAGAKSREEIEAMAKSEIL